MSRRIIAVGVILSGLALSLLASAPAARAQEKKPDPHAELIGKPAPSFEGDFNINGNAKRLADLKGKVVMLDFWAVWCGPCIATFPHLRDLNTKHKGEGLEIVGLTTYYQKYGFDKGKLTKAEQPLSVDQEQAMLKDFAKHHKLDHLLLATSREKIKSVYEAYKVRGIPQVVLIDRKGVVRLVKVGSGEANAKAIEEMVKKLLAEDASSS